MRRGDESSSTLRNEKKKNKSKVCKNMKADPRLTVLKKEWFEDKYCLDIGCNQGLITIEIAKTYHCRSICGVDIDASLVESTYWNLKKIARMESDGFPSPDVSEPNHLDRERDLKYSDAISSEEGKHDHPKSLLDIVSFQKQNFVDHLCKHSDGEKYDTMPCFSVTKWIHLNWGDEGLITLFQNIWKLLRQGGILVLEPPPWKSYKSNYLVSEVVAESILRVVSSKMFLMVHSAHTNHSMGIRALVSVVCSSTSRARIKYQD